MMNKLVTIAVCTALTATGALAQQNTDLDESGVFTEGKYRFGEHDELSSWAYYFSPSMRTFNAAVSAVDFNYGISRATLKISCADTFAGKNIRFSVAYLMAGGVYPGDEYLLDLFNSVGSGRPAAYDIGKGFVRTDHIELGYSSRDKVSKEYLDMTRTFWTDLQQLSESKTIEVRFKLDKVPGSYISAEFPLDGFSEIAESSAPYCP